MRRFFFCFIVFFWGGGGAVKHFLADGKKGKSKYIAKSVVSLDLCNAAHLQMNSIFVFQSVL